MLPLLWGNLSNLINLPLVSWVIIQGNDAILGAECLSVLLVVWGFSGGCNQVSLVEQKSILLSPYIASIPVFMATWFMNTLDNDRGRWGKRSFHKTGHPIHLVTKIILRLSFGEHWHVTQIYSCFLGGSIYISLLHIQGGLSTYLFSTFLHYQFSNHVLCKSLANSQTVATSPWISI